MGFTTLPCFVADRNAAPIALDPAHEGGMSACAAANTSACMLAIRAELIPGDHVSALFFPWPEMPGLAIQELMPGPKTAG